MMRAFRCSSIRAECRGNEGVGPHHRCTDISGDVGRLTCHPGGFANRVRGVAWVGDKALPPPRSLSASTREPETLAMDQTKAAVPHLATVMAAVRPSAADGAGSAPPLRDKRQANPAGSADRSPTDAGGPSPKRAIQRAGPQDLDSPGGTSVQVGLAAQIHDRSTRQAIQRPDTRRDSALAPGSGP
jgi:hypothetical protein